MKNQKSLGILNSGQRLFFTLGLTFNLILGAHSVHHQLMSTGDIIMVHTLMMQLLSPLFFLGTSYRFWF